jgi:L-lactate dehydrogenase complex protein LldG
MSDARREILERVSAATANGAAPRSWHVARGYRRSGSLGPEARVDLFCDRVGEYRAEVLRIAEADIGDAVATVCGARGAGTLVIPDELPGDWRPKSVELATDRELSPHALDAIDGALTGCTTAVAETGTIILTASPHEGRRAITLVPDLHICVVRESQIVELLPEALERVEAEGLDRRPLTLISGPSATSDIELSRVEGVHGPRNLVVIVAKEVL